jgi:hypothetical protein
VHSSRPLLHGESVQKATDHILRWGFDASGQILNDHVIGRLGSVIPDHAFIRNLVYTWNHVRSIEPIKGPERTGMETLRPFYPFQSQLLVVFIM